MAENQSPSVILFHSSGHSVTSVSDTARWVAAYRYLERFEDHPLFLDPLAQKLAGPGAVELAQSIPFWEWARWGLALRTRELDQWIVDWCRKSDESSRVINFAAGLDSRPFRLSIPSTVEWLEVDLPDISSWKQNQLREESPVCSLTFRAINLADDTERKNFLGSLSTKRTLIITEGLLMYLPDIATQNLIQEVTSTLNPETWLLDFYSKFGRRMMTIFWSKILKGAPMVSEIRHWDQLFMERGWKLGEKIYLGEIAKKYRRFPRGGRFLSRLGKGSAGLMRLERATG